MPRKVTISGGAFERGRQYGEQAGRLIRKGVEFYVDMWEKGSGRTRGELIEIISGFAGKIGDFDAEILTEIEGIAAGSGLAVDDVLIVNGRYEIMLSTLFAGAPAGSGECTSLGIARASESGHTLVGQNWDWAVPVGEVSILLEVRQEDRPDILTHVEAGFVGHKGINSEGLALCANAMGSQLDRFEAAVPVWVLARAALNCSSIDEARRTLEPAERVASVNFTMAQPGAPGSGEGKVASLEVSPADVAVVAASPGGRASHCNVFADASEDGPPRERGLEDRLAVQYPGFCDRARRAGELIGEGEAGSERLKAILRDHENRPESICRHREDQPDELVLETLASVVMDVSAGTLEVADGPPCSNPYRAHRLSRS